MGAREAAEAAAGKETQEASCARCRGQLGATRCGLGS